MIYMACPVPLEMSLVSRRNRRGIHGAHLVCGIYWVFVGVRVLGGPDTQRVV